MINGSAEWLIERRKGIGGSDCAAALGLSKFRTPFQLYKEKIGEAEPVDDNWAMAHGRTVEPLLRQHYANTTGRIVRVPLEPIVHPQYSFMRYNPDGLSDDGRLQEFKTASDAREWGESGSDEIPKEYLLQVQHGMIVTQREVADVTVSIGGREPKYFVVERDRELQEMIIDGEAAFWDMVQNRIEPEPITNEDVSKKFSRVNGASIAADAIIQEFYDGLRDVREKIKYLEDKKEEYEVAIKNFMGENETLLHIDGHTPLATWKQQRGAVRIDSAALKKELSDIAARYSNQGEPIRRFLLK